MIILAVVSLTIIILTTRGVIYAPSVINYTSENVYSTGSLAIFKIIFSRYHKSDCGKAVYYKRSLSQIFSIFYKRLVDTIKSNLLLKK